MNILTILMLLIHEHRIPFHIFVSSSISFQSPLWPRESTRLFYLAGLSHWLNFTIQQDCSWSLQLLLVGLDFSLCSPTRQCLWLHSMFRQGAGRALWLDGAQIMLWD